MATRTPSISGGVRNLRAMFENGNKDEGSSSPPSDIRGRSPAGSIGSAGSSPHPRPLSKVRTSFIAVETRAVQMVRSRESEENGSMSGRRPAFSKDEKEFPEEAAERRSSIQAEFIARKNSTVIEETIPELAVASVPGTPLGEAIARPGLSSVREMGSYMNGARGEIKAEEEAGSDTATATENANAAFSKAIINGDKALGNGHKEKAEEMKLEKKPTATRPAAATHSKTATTAKPAKPVVTSARISTTKPPSTPPAKRSTSRPPPQKEHAKTTLARATSKAGRTSAIGPPPKKAGSPETNRKPREPTRPVALPASLTAPTASSRSKLACETVSAKPQITNTRVPTSSANGSHTSTSRNTVRSPSRSSLASGTSGVRRTSSLVAKNTSGTNRPSLGRPLPVPSTTKPKEVKHADQGFLARMMKPTAASSSKVHEKVVTPPRRAASSRPTTREGSAKSVVKPVGSPLAKKKASGLDKVDEGASENKTGPPKMDVMANAEASKVGKPATEEVATKERAPAAAKIPDPTTVSAAKEDIEKDEETVEEMIEVKTPDKAQASANVQTPTPAETTTTNTSNEKHADETVGGLASQDMSAEETKALEDFTPRDVTAKLAPEPEPETPGTTELKKLLQTSDDVAKSLKENIA